MMAAIGEDTVEVYTAVWEGRGKVWRSGSQFIPEKEVNWQKCLGTDDSLKES